MAELKTCAICFEDFPTLIQCDYCPMEACTTCWRNNFASKPDEIQVCMDGKCKEPLSLMFLVKIYSKKEIPTVKEQIKNYLMKQSKGQFINVQQIMVYFNAVSTTIQLCLNSMNLFVEKTNLEDVHRLRRKGEDKNPFFYEFVRYVITFRKILSNIYKTLNTQFMEKTYTNRYTISMSSTYTARHTEMITDEEFIKNFEKTPSGKRQEILDNFPYNYDEKLAQLLVHLAQYQCFDYYTFLWLPICHRPVIPARSMGPRTKDKKTYISICYEDAIYRPFISYMFNVRRMKMRQLPELMPITKQHFTLYVIQGYHTHYKSFAMKEKAKKTILAQAPAANENAAGWEQIPEYNEQEEEDEEEEEEDDDDGCQCTSGLSLQ